MSRSSTLIEVTERIIQRSQRSRSAYLAHVRGAAHQGVQRQQVSCTNLAHGMAALPKSDQLILRQERLPSVAIISAYNDLLSAHQPFERFPKIIKDAVRAAGGVAQFTAGTPAMCDGITQGQPGMELSLFSRDTIAMATAIGLTHNLFDAAVYLGVCDKIVPGLLIGALHFGHIPAVFIPAGPMVSGLSNMEKARIRQQYAEGSVDRATLLESEARSYHDAGTCTFYGTANSNQMLMEVMGLHLPGAAFIPPNTPLRDALTAAAAVRAVQITAQGSSYIPVGDIVDESCIVNAMVALLATGGSTNHTIHLVAIAKAAGIVIDWNDFAALSAIVPTLAKIYPNGSADVNHFHAAGGVGWVIRELLDAGLLHDDVMTILGRGLRAHCVEPYLKEQTVQWKPVPVTSADESVLRTVGHAFSTHGGLAVLSGNIGRAIMKTSAIKPEGWHVQAPALVFHSQEALMQAYHAGALFRDFVAVLPYQGPRANGMPELHALMPALTNLQDAGHRVALVTDGRLSGASGKIPAAIHVTPEACMNGALGKVRDGDMIDLDARSGILQVLVDTEEWDARTFDVPHEGLHQTGFGRELFRMFRTTVRTAEEGATTFG